jgi:hypothetical protein
MSHFIRPHDGTITEADLEALHELAKKEGWNELMLRIIEREPLLAVPIGTRWSRICEELLAADVDEPRTRSILKEITILLVETTGLQQQAQRRMLDGFLPEDMEGGTNE